ncbi:TetR/AcrR family transcriptional regulator [Maricaulis sp.]|uniref:TetR/AcrR family transcriptional regulator n=1 Tax=Maricaulis sp. TaxID=1486257 RepID=UPI00261A5072|nr:TetR/AcrR family transcriptional regulator [Maricaulis sp.]
MLKPVPSAKQKFIDTALPLFADRGYFGVSLADVAGELKLTKQSIIYHFRTKDALYGAVIEDIATRLDGILDVVMAAPAERPQDRLDLYVRNMHDHMQSKPQDARLITRELLDNLDRTETGKRWYLKRFLDVSVALMAGHPKWAGKSPAEQTAATYQFIGAVCYFAISGPTLSAIWGKDRVQEIRAAFLPTLRDQVVS